LKNNKKPPNLGLGGGWIFLCGSGLDINLPGVRADVELSQRPNWNAALYEEENRNRNGDGNQRKAHTLANLCQYNSTNSLQK
jgi:hypothetical protein